MSNGPQSNFDSTLAMGVAITERGIVVRIETHAGDVFDMPIEAWWQAVSMIAHGLAEAAKQQL